MSQPTAYEARRYADLCAWRDQPPPPVRRASGKVARRVTDAVSLLVPAAVLRYALQVAQAAAGRLRDEHSILERAHVDALSELAADSLEHCDALARQVQRRSMLMAGATGAVFGVTGAAGLAADIPSLLVIAFRSIHRVGLCYGEDCMHDDAHTLLPLAVFALACANTPQDKHAAWTALAELERHEPGAQALRNSAVRTLNQGMAKTTAALGFSRIAQQASTRLGWRLAGSAIPIAGAVIGSSANAWYLRDIAATAECTFQWRWLHAHYPALP
ncbi:MAG: hypothetical protein EPN72_02510 [Nevskiaceae bacterium]|nr:MAG: hypothetical protein EPN63_11140 [Nevskiaceae bacterium]TBR74431.1 MAG: hypothetical protein EPN72_02510 [Nevskiaceae bacterium]